MDTKLFDHTILKADATREMVERDLRESKRASLYVRLCKQLLYWICGR